MKSFVDLLFILLCGTIVMLSRSVEVGAVEINPAKVGSGGVSEVQADDVRVVSVNQDGITVSDGSDGVVEYDNVVSAADSLGKDKCILLSASADGVTHHRIMRVWSGFVKAGFNVKLAAVEESNEANAE
jgi:biopolymer transport protein ExbD